MKPNKLFRIIAGLALSLMVLAACGGGGETSPTEDASRPTVAAETATPAPTSTPAATPTPSADDHVAEGARLHELGQLEDAAAAFQEAIALDPEHAVAYFQLGMVYYDLGRFAESLAALEKAAELDPNDPDTQRNLGTAYGKMNEWEKAIAPYEKAVELKPDFGEAYGDLAGAYANTGKIADAIAAGEKAIELAPEYVTAHNNLGIAYGMQGDLDQAITLFKKALQINPEDAMAHYNLGFAYDNQNLLDQAIFEYREAIRIDPDYGDARENLGSVLARQNKFDEAIAEWQALLERDPERASAQRFLGMAYATQEKYTEAIAAYEAYLVLAPNAPDKADIEQQIAKLNAQMTEAETSYRNAAGGYSFPRPAGWYYEETKALVKFSESETALKNAPDSAPLIMYQAGPANELAANLDVAIEADAATYLQAMAQSAKLKVNTPENGTVGGYPAALSAVASESSGLQGAMIVVLVEGRVVNGFALSPPDQWEVLQSIFITTFQGLTFTLPEYRNDAGGYGLSYPGSLSYEEDDEMVSFALTEAALEDSEKAALEEGLLIAFDASPASELADKLKVENRDDPEAFVTAMAESFDAQVSNIETGEIAGYPVAYANISGTYLDVPYTGGLVAILVDGRLIGGYAMAAPEHWGTVRPVFSDMLDSMTFFEP